MYRFSTIIHVILFLFFCQMTVSAQQKWDAVWLFGYGFPSGDTIVYHTKFDFHYDPVKITATGFGLVNFAGGDANSGICDADGNLQFATDKCIVSSWNGWPPMQGGEKMTNDKSDSIYCISGGGLGPQSTLALPWPDSADQYILFYYGYAFVATAGAHRPIKLYWARIDMRLNNGLGAVVEKHNIGVQDTLAACYLQAVRHANGRDWWILAPEGGNNGYYTLLLTPMGIQKTFRQYFGEPWSSMQKVGLGQAVFSPDGHTYARMNWHYDLHVFDFDRCSGLLSNERTATFPDNPPYQTGGVAISANSRYVYATTTTRLWQLDLQSPDLDDSKILIDTYDGQPFPNYGVFYLSYLAPDNKIYIAGTSSHRHLHVINAPDSAGLACDFAQHGVPIPTFNYVSLPNYPHFRLGVSASPCDSMSGVGMEPKGRAGSFAVYPNPASDAVDIAFDQAASSGCRIEVLSMMGQLIGSQNVPDGTVAVTLPLDNYPNGYYFLRVVDAGRKIPGQKIIIIR